MLSDLHHILTFGPLQTGWKDLGGPVCFDEIPSHIHLAESSAWLSLAALFYKCMDISTQMKHFFLSVDSEIKQCHVSFFQRCIETIMGITHITLFFAILRYKILSKALVFILQPCHIICFAQGVALLSGTSLGVAITLAILPALVGTILALVFPENSDLMLPFEVETFWIEHWLLVLTPLFLLVRHDGVAVRHFDAVKVAVGLWILLIAHFAVHEIASYGLMVNVEFMLCPTEQIDTVLNTWLPSLYARLTHRSLITLLVFVGGTFVAYLYAVTAYLLRRLIAAPSDVLFPTKSKGE